MKRKFSDILFLFVVIIFSCGDKEEVEPHVHDWQWVITIEATAETDGLETETCAICGETRGTRAIPKTGGGADPVDVMIDGLTLDNYPIVDGSTSTNPLNNIIAARLLGYKYNWTRGNIWGVGFQPYDVYIRGLYDELGQDSADNFYMTKLKCTQTHNAITGLIDGQNELIIVARKMSPDEEQHAKSLGVSLIETPVALDALDFIVNPNNPVNSLTVGQIQSIYLGNMVNWSEAGGADEAIKPYIRNANSGSQEMMNEIVMNGEGMDGWEVSYSDADGISSMFAVYEELTRQPNGICFTPHYYKDFMVRDVFDDRGAKTLAINEIIPNKNSIENKTYPFIADVYVSIRSDVDSSSMAYKLYEWLQTETGKRVVRESGYVVE